MKLIIDTDPGIDDAMAIFHAHADPQIELLGLTTIFGNTFVHQSSRNARYLLDMMALEIPVAEGAALPWGETTYTPSAIVHGDEGFGDLNDIPEIGQNAPESAPEFLTRMAREHRGELVVCAIGPLTNIADAIALDPEFVGNVGRIVFMGGALDCAGNITPHAEANIFHDARAADAVLSSGAPLEMVGLDVTLQTLYAAEDFAALAERSPKFGGFLNEISQFYLEFYRSVGHPEGCGLHDSTAVIACTHPELFETEETGLRVICAGETTGDTIRDETRPSMKVYLNVDGKKVVDLFSETVARNP